MRRDRYIHNNKEVIDRNCFFEMGPVSKHPLVSTDGKQGGVQVSWESPFTQGQLLHFSGNFLVSLLNSEKHGLILTQSMETKDVQEELAFSFQLTSIMAFITKPAPFTMAIDGCYRKEPLKTLFTDLTPWCHATKTATVAGWNKLPGRVWTRCGRLMQPFQAACRTAAPPWSRCKGRRVQTSRSLAKSWWLELLFHGPKTKSKRHVRLHLWTYDTCSIQINKFSISHLEVSRVGNTLRHKSKYIPH